MIRDAREPRNTRAAGAAELERHEHIAVATINVIDRLLPARPMAHDRRRRARRRLDRRFPPLDELGAELAVGGDGERGDAQRRPQPGRECGGHGHEPFRAAERRRDPFHASAGTRPQGMRRERDRHRRAVSRRAVTLPIAGCPDVPTTIMAASRRSATSSRPAGADRAWCTREATATSLGSRARARSTAARAMPSRRPRYSLSPCTGSSGQGDGTTAHTRRSSCADRASIPARWRTAPPRPSGAYPTTRVIPRAPRRP